MEKIKKFFSVLSEKIQDSNKKLKIKKDNFEEKIDPSFGKKLSKVFKTMTLISVIIVLPIIVIIFGSIVSVNNQPDYTGPIIDISTQDIVIPTVVPWLVLTTFFASLWFFFSKWNVVVEDGK